MTDHQQQQQNQFEELIIEDNSSEYEEELEAYQCPHEYEHVDHLETVADKYRNELYVCVLCDRQKVVKHYFGVRD
jgi:hypothetical protein